MLLKEGAKACQSVMSVSDSMSRIGTAKVRAHLDEIGRHCVLVDGEEESSCGGFGRLSLNTCEPRYISKKRLPPHLSHRRRLASVVEDSHSGASSSASLQT